MRSIRRYVLYLFMRYAILAFLSNLAFFRDSYQDSYTFKRAQFTLAGKRRVLQGSSSYTESFLVSNLP